MLKEIKFPKDFLFGTATASLQIEGGDTNNSWYRWSNMPGKIIDGTNCSVANDHWNRVDEDIDLMKKLNMQTYRMSLEWSRIEPEEGQFNKDAINHYRDEIVKLKKAGIEPIVTLHHFSNPLWMEDRGSWTNKQAVKNFSNYTNYVVSKLGDLISSWVTINEPNVYLQFGYVAGQWPPGLQSIGAYIKGAKNMIKAHVKSYKIIHQVRKEMGFSDTEVGVAHHIRIFEPKNDKFIEKIISKIQNRLFHEVFIVGMASARIIFPFSFFSFKKGNFQDFFGINYYSRDMISFNPKNVGQLFGDMEVKQGAETNDLGWEIYPRGIYLIAKKYFNRYKKPIYITENGTCDAKDDFRAKYIYDHLEQISIAIEEGIDIKRYYHWTLIDNFEWSEGESARFGLIEVDYKTQKRTVRKSGHFFGEIAKNGEITGKIAKKYL